MRTVTVRMRASDLAHQMAAMREWLDRHRYEAARFVCDQHGDAVDVSVVFLTIRRVRRSHRGSTAKNPSGRHRSQVELVTSSQRGSWDPFARGSWRPQTPDRVTDARLTARPRHFTETTARPFLPHPRHRSCALSSRSSQRGGGQSGLTHTARRGGRGRMGARRPA
jgi:hypothetical protein